MRIILLLLILFIITGCATMIDIQRREQYIVNHPGLNEDIKIVIKKGKIKIGMSKEQVVASWGNPCDINKTATLYGITEQWVYSYACYDYTIGKQQYLYFDNDILTSWQN